LNVHKLDPLRARCCSLNTPDPQVWPTRYDPPFVNGHINILAYYAETHGLDDELSRSAALLSPVGGDMTTRQESSTTRQESSQRALREWMPVTVLGKYWIRLWECRGAVGIVILARTTAYISFFQLTSVQ
jgi:hypothetical protein